MVAWATSPKPDDYLDRARRECINGCRNTDRLWACQRCHTAAGLMADAVALDRLTRFPRKAPVSLEAIGTLVDFLLAVCKRDRLDGLDAVADLLQGKVDEREPCHGPDDRYCPTCGLGGKL